MRTTWFPMLALSMVAILILVGCTQPAPAAPTTAPQKPAAPAATAAPTAAPATAPIQAPAPQPTAAPKVAYPQKGRAIQIMIPFSAGGGADLVTRIFAPLLERELGTPVELLNKPGASTQTGITELVRARPDGYYIGVTPLPSILVPILNTDTKAGYTLKDLAPIANFALQDNIIDTLPTSPYKTMKDVIDAARANPEKVKTADAGLLSNTHLLTLALMNETGVKFATVHFGGGGEASASVLGGHTDVGINSSADVTSHYKNGTLRLLATAGTKQSAFFPDVKCLADLGFKSNTIYVNGISAPAGTPKEIIDVLTSATKRAIDNSEFKTRLADLSTEVQFMDTAEYTAYTLDYQTRLTPLMQMAKEITK